MEELFTQLDAIYPMPPELREYLAIHFRPQNFRKKELILKAGHTSERIYFIRKGLVRCYYTEGDKEFSSWFLTDGDLLISDSSFFSQGPSRENIQALEDCQMHYLTYGELQYVYTNFLSFNYNARVLLEKYYKIKDDRLLSFMNHSAADRYRYLVENHPRLVQRVPSIYLASYLGISRYTLSRIRREIMRGPAVLVSF